MWLGCCVQQPSERPSVVVPPCSISQCVKHYCVLLLQDHWLAWCFAEWRKSGPEGLTIYNLPPLQKLGTTAPLNGADGNYKHKHLGGHQVGEGCS